MIWTSSKKNSISSRTGLEPRSSPDVFSLGFPQNPDKLFLRNLDPLEGIFSGAWIHVCKQDDWLDDEELFSDPRSDLIRLELVAMNHWLKNYSESFTFNLRNSYFSQQLQMDFRMVASHGFLGHGGGLVVSVLAFYLRRRSKFESCWLLKFSVRKDENKQKRGQGCSILKSNTLN